jgi:uncharacterized repeat protein (TIGR03803 family)
MNRVAKHHFAGIALAFLLATTGGVAQTWSYELVHGFGVSPAEGANPYARLVQGNDGSFFGTTTTSGGPPASGAIFRMNAAWHVVAQHQFESTFDCIPGAIPGKAYAALVQAGDGKLYGTTCRQPGFGSAGTTFRIDADGAFQPLHVFSAIPEGLRSAAALLPAADGLFYGTTVGGVADPNVCPFGSCGAVFKMDSSGGVTVLHNFGDSGDGAYPQAALIQANDGDFYGTTAGGIGSPGCPISSACATAFRMDSAGTVTTLHTFASDYPDQPLLQGLDGAFYSTTRLGGDYGYGSVFRMDASGSVTNLHSFDVTVSAYPSGPLVQLPDGVLYGMASGCCGFSDGVLFTIDPVGGFGTVHAFGGPEGANPSGGLIIGSDGNLYGVASNGGPAGGGVIFRLTHASFSVNAIEPRSGPAPGGVVVYLLGGGFLTGASMTIGTAPVTDATTPDPTFLSGTAPALTPGTLNDVTVANPAGLPGASGTLTHAYFADFLDVPQSDNFHDFVERIFRAGVTAGCGGGNFCRDTAALRKQMAVFMLKAKEGSSYTPPPAVGIFADVPASDPFAPWIEELHHRGVVAGCGDGSIYCPNDPVLRQQMAVVLLKTLLGSTYVPPACAGLFGDVPCSNPFAVWIEDLYTQGIAAGCGGGDYCPDNPTTRGQMSVFLTKTFSLP